MSNTPVVVEAVLITDDDYFNVNIYFYNYLLNFKLIIYFYNTIDKKRKK